MTKNYRANWGGEKRVKEKNLDFLKQSIKYHFVRSKDVYMENGTIYITVFARLSKEYNLFTDGRWHTHIETIWVDLEDIRKEHAPNRIKQLSNHLQQYQVSESVFRNLHFLAETDAEKLFLTTPMYEQYYSQPFSNEESLSTSSCT